MTEFGWLIHPYIDTEHSINTPIIKYVQYLPGESLTSWCIRSASANLTSPLLFLNLFNIFNPGDIDSKSSISDLENINAYIRTPKELVNLENAQTLIRLNAINPHYRNTLLKYRNEYIYRFCPLCLSERVTYLRTKWRFTFNVVCETHKCLLHSICPNCKKPQDISILNKQIRYNSDTTLFQRCFFCDFKLNNITPKYIPNSLNTNCVLSKQRLFWKFLNHRHIPVVYIGKRNSCNKPINNYSHYVQSGNYQHKYLVLRDIIRKYIDCDIYRANNLRILSYSRLFGAYAEKYIEEHFSKN